MIDKAWTQHLNMSGKEEVMMNRACIAIDVSKGGSHVCGFKGYNQKYKSVFTIKHDREGFDLLDILYEELNDTEEAVFIFESTGIYHRPLRFYLEEKGYPYIETSPLLSAKHRKNSSIRSAKTDARDTSALAKLYYEVELSETNPKTEVYYELRQLHRYYIMMTDYLVKSKVHFNEKLDILYPNFRKEVSDDVYKTYYLELLERYPHPNLISKTRVDAIENILIKNGMRRSRANTQANHIKGFSKNCFSGTYANSVDTIIFKELIKDVKRYTKRRNETIDTMTELGKSLPLYNQLLSIPGIGPVIAIRLIAELGDLSNFYNDKQLTAYAGLDPIIYQSGNINGKGLSISKKGNKHLRTVLYQAINISVYLKEDNSFKEYFQKKKQTVTTQSAYTACSDKLLRTIFSMNRTGATYKFQ